MEQKKQTGRTCISYLLILAWLPDVIICQKNMPPDLLPTNLFRSRCWTVSSILSHIYRYWHAINVTSLAYFITKLVRICNCKTCTYICRLLKYLSWPFTARGVHLYRRIKCGHFFLAKPHGCVGSYSCPLNGSNKYGSYLIQNWSSSSSWG